MLHITEEDIMKEQIKIEPLTYRTTVCVEYSTPSNKYWEPMLRTQTIREVNSWMEEIAKVSVSILNEAILSTNNVEEMNECMNFRFFLESYLKDTSI
jgi:hypothetical protein